MLAYRKPFGGPADPVNNLDPIQTLFWPKGIQCRAREQLTYRNPFGGPADPVKKLDPILTGFWPKGGAARAAAH